jgi:transcriptional regulator with XRE-family HTH domain
MIDLPTPEERRTEAQRLLAGLNGQYVAERMGESKSTISKWRRGERTPSLEDLLRLPGATGRQLAGHLQDRLRRIGISDDEEESLRGAVEGLTLPPAGETTEGHAEDDPDVPEPRSEQRR